MNASSLLIRAGLCGAVLSALTAAAAAQDFERIAPKEPPANPPAGALPVPPVPAPTPGGSAVLVPELKGLLFLAKDDQLRRQGVAATGVDSGRVDVLDDPEFRARIAPFLGKPVTFDLLNDITRVTVVYFREKDHPLVDVVIPEQDISNGTVQILALEFLAGSVRAEGNQWFSDDVLLSQVRTRPGDRIRASTMLDDVNWLNLNPFRRIDLVYERSQEPGRSNIALRTIDRLPLRVFGGYENTGTASTERGRVFAGFNWGNVLGLDHQLSYQHTTSPSVWDDRLRGGGGRARSASHSGSYFVPLPWRHKLTMFGSYSENLPAVETGFDQVGRSSQASVRYGVPLPKLWSVEQEVQAGFDWKRSNSDLGFGGTSVSSTSTDVAQWMVGYVAARADEWGATAFNASLFLSPGGFNNRNTAASFQTQRAGAEADYRYARLGAERVTTLPGAMAWTVRVQGQLADGALLASEQLGFGGVTSVRGYEEREANGDQGIIVSNEVSSPAYSPLTWLAGRAMDDQLKLLAFWDYGIANNRQSGNGVPKTAHLSGVGVGLRYALAPYVSARFDYGWALTGAKGSRPHVGITIAF